MGEIGTFLATDDYIVKLFAGSLMELELCPSSPNDFLCKEYTIVIKNKQVRTSGSGQSFL